MIFLITQNGLNHRLHSTSCGRCQIIRVYLVSPGEAPVFINRLWSPQPWVLVLSFPRLTVSYVSLPIMLALLHNTSVLFSSMALAWWADTAKYYTRVILKNSRNLLSQVLGGNERSRCEIKVAFLWELTHWLEGRCHKVFSVFMIAS